MTPEDWDSVRIGDKVGLPTDIYKVVAIERHKTTKTVVNLTLRYRKDVPPTFLVRNTLADDVAQLLVDADVVYSRLREEDP